MLTPKPPPTGKGGVPTPIGGGKHNKHRDPHRDWPAVALEYETGDDTVTLPVLARKHGISYTAMRTHSAKEGWLERRAKFRLQTIEAARRELQKKFASGLVTEFDKLDGLKARIVGKIINGQRVKVVVKDPETGKNEIFEYEADVNLNSLDAGTKAYNDLVKMQAYLAGMPSEITRQEQTGAGGGPVQTQTEMTVTTDDHLGEVARILAEAGAFAAPDQAAPEAADDEVHSP